MLGFFIPTVIYYILFPQKKVYKICNFIYTKRHREEYTSHFLYNISIVTYLKNFYFAIYVQTVVIYYHFAIFKMSFFLISYFLSVNNYIIKSISILHAILTIVRLFLTKKNPQSLAGF